MNKVANVYIQHEDLTENVKQIYESLIPINKKN